MAASKPTSWLFGHFHFLVTLSVCFGALAGDLGCFPFDYEPYHPQSHSQASRYGIRSLVEFGRTPVPRIHPVLYPRNETPKAAPQCISGRTSYYPTRLAFHS